MANHLLGISYYATKQLPEAEAAQIKAIHLDQGKTNVTMKVVASEKAVPASVHFLGVLGTAKRDGTAVHARASTAPALRRRFPQMLYVPAEIDGVVALGIIP